MFQRETEFLPEPAAALSPCTHRSLPDCTESTKEKEETGSSTGVCLVYKASFAEFPIPIGQCCQAVPALLCCRAQGRVEQEGGRAGFLFEKGLALYGDTGSARRQHPCQGVPVLEAHCPAWDGALLAHAGKLCLLPGAGGICHPL